MTTELIRRIDELALTVGGRFRLAALIQRRMQEIIRTAPHVVHQSRESPLRLVLKEIEEGKIELEADEGTVDATTLLGA
jgi:DNA-directed RNA polymerase subunit K/omega